MKLLLSVLIPDEPDWIRKKRERIEFKSLQALREQVNQRMYSVSLRSCVLLIRVTMELLLLLFSRGPIPETPDCITKCGGYKAGARLLRQLWTVCVPGSGGFQQVSRAQTVSTSSL